MEFRDVDSAPANEILRFWSSADSAPANDIWEFVMLALSPPEKLLHAPPPPLCQPIRPTLIQAKVVSGGAPVASGRHLYEQFAIGPGRFSTFPARFVGANLLGPAKILISKFIIVLLSDLLRVFFLVEVEATCYKLDILQANMDQHANMGQLIMCFTIA